jgi:O-antigen/teichoic acid export membrane protein
VWRILSLAEAYAAFATFGIPNGFLRQYPIDNGAGRRGANAARTKALYFSQGIQAVIGLAITFYLSNAMPALRHSPWLVLAFFFYGLYFVVTRFKVAAETFLRAEGRFRTLAKAYWLLAALRAVSLLLIAVWGFHGFLIRWPATMLIEWLVLQSMTQLKWRGLVGFPKISTLIELGRDGVPTLVIGSIGAFSDSFDRRWLALHAAAASVGMYFIADAVKMFFAQIFGGVALVQYNKCGLAFGRSDSAGMWHAFYSAMRWLALAYMGSAVLLWVGITFGVPLLLPAYTPGISASLILLVGAVWLGVASLGFPLIVTRNYAWGIAASCCGLGVQALAQAILGGRMPPGTMVATAWSAGQAANALVMLLGVIIVLRKGALFQAPAPEGRNLRIKDL